MPYLGRSTTGFGIRDRFQFTASGSETTISGSDDNGRTLKFSDGKYVDVYLNGKLVRSCVMHEYPVPSSGDIYIGHKEGFNGYISSLKYYPTILTPDEIYKLYTTGPKIQKKDIQVESDAEYSVIASSL